MAYIIEYNSKECIGAGECEKMCPDLWKMNSKGKAELKGATPNASGRLERQIDDSQLALQKRISGACPAACIKIRQ